MKKLRRAVALVIVCAVALAVITLAISHGIGSPYGAAICGLILGWALMEVINWIVERQ